MCSGCFGTSTDLVNDLEKRIQADFALCFFLVYSSDSMMASFIFLAGLGPDVQALGSPVLSFAHVKHPGVSRAMRFAGAAETVSSCQDRC